MFKKSNRNFRSKRNDSDEDNNSNSNSNEIIHIKTTEAAVIVEELPKKSTKSTILSFDLEEDEGETFKIKKSKESRKMAKEKKKEKKSKDDESGFQNKIENKKSEETKDDKAEIIINENDEIILFNEGIKLKPLKQKNKLNEDMKNLTFKSDGDKTKNKMEIKEILIDSEDELRKLREEMDILNGDQDDFENETDEQKRSMKLLLKTGHIPDSSMIHEARKKRELARQGYISINNNNNDNKESKSRLVREEDEISDEEERISFDILEKSNKEKQITRENFLAFEQGSDDDEEEIDEEEKDVYERWEKEQIKKGVQLTQIIQMQKHGNINTTVLEKIYGYSLETEDMNIEEQSPDIQLHNLPHITFDTIKEMLKLNINTYDETYRAHLNERNMIQVNLNSNKHSLENLKEEKPKVNDQYTFYQSMRSYIADIIDCYNEKLVDIEKIESKWINLMKQHAIKFIQRRQDDIKDQNTEYSLNVTQGVPESDVIKVIDVVHQRRLNDREARRSRRKKLREANNSTEIHYEGLSSDDDESPGDKANFNQKRTDIIGRVPELLNDVIEDFSNIDIIKSKFEEWRLKYPSTYEDAYVSLSLPKLFSPLIRLELIDWNPLETGSKNFDSKKWIHSLKTYYNPSVLVNEDDSLLITRIIEKIIFNKLIEIIENVYDPFSTKQTENLTNLIKYLLTQYPILKNSNQNTQKVLDAVTIRIRKTFDNDIFVPLFSKAIIDNKSSSSSIFFYRQFWSCVKLFNNIIEWNDILTIKTLQELSLDCLFNRYIMVALQCMELNNETVTRIEYIVRKFPHNWFENLTQSQSIPQLNNLCRLLKRIIDNIQKDFDENKIDQKTFKENIRQIRKLFVKIQSMDNAIELTNKYQIK